MEAAAPVPAPAALALALTGRRRPFLRALAADGVPDTLARVLEAAADPMLGEAAAAQAIVESAAGTPAEASAVTACGAIAARLVGQRLQAALGTLDPAEAAALLQAAQDAAREIVAARGAAGLRLLPSLAVLLARRAVARGEAAAVVAEVMRRIAARIAADPTLGSGLGRPGADQRRTRGMPGPPSRLVLDGPVAIALHAR